MDSVRENLRAAKKEFAKTEDDLKSLQSVGQIIGEVLRPLDNERCTNIYFCSWNLIWRLLCFLHPKQKLLIFPLLSCIEGRLNILIFLELKSIFIFQLSILLSLIDAFSWSYIFSYLFPSSCSCCCLLAVRYITGWGTNIYYHTV
jgi:hypothetical protein